MEVAPKKRFIMGRKLPAELMDELFRSLPLEIALKFLHAGTFGIFDQLLAKNVEKMIQSIKTATKKNKWNLEKYGPVLIISNDGIGFQPYGAPGEFICVRSVLPIPKLLPIGIIAYFEAKILTYAPTISGLALGFATNAFELMGEMVEFHDYGGTITISDKGGVYIDGSSYIQFGDSGEKFVVGDSIGLGISFFPGNELPKFFATCNGKLLGMAELPRNFLHLQLYPMAIFCEEGILIQTNFGQEEWTYDLKELPI